MSALRNVLTAAALSSILAVLAADSSHATDYNWQVGSGSWGEAANWGGGVPAPADSAWVRNGGTVTADTR